MPTPDEPSPPPDGVSRRTALRVSGGALALVLGGGVTWLVRRDDDAPAVPRPTYETLPAAGADAPVFADVDPGIIAVGTRYVQTHPDDADLDTLLRSFPAVDGDPLDVAAMLTREEFRLGDTVTVDGWVLARSEARAAAVVALSCAGDRC